jgi:hypothetical protein
LSHYSATRCYNLNKGKARTAAEVVKLIRGQPEGDDLITGARKLPSGAFALTFKSVKAKKAWQEQGALEATFGASAKTTESTLDVIVFGFPKGAVWTMISSMPEVTTSSAHK